jgi:hypothetical protein
MGSSGSQKRKVTARIAVNCTPAQKAAIMEKSDATGLSPSAMCLAALLDVPLPKRRRPSVNDRAMTAYLAANARLSDAVRASLAELGKVNSNVNQIAYMLNANTAPERIMNLIETGLQEHRDAQAKHQDILDDLHELRTMAMEALGYEH